MHDVTSCIGGTTIDTRISIIYGITADAGYPASEVYCIFPLRDESKQRSAWWGRYIYIYIYLYYNYIQYIDITCTITTSHSEIGLIIIILIIPIYSV